MSRVLEPVFLSARSISAQATGCTLGKTASRSCSFSAVERNTASGTISVGHSTAGKTTSRGRDSTRKRVENGLDARFSRNSSSGRETGSRLSKRAPERCTGKPTHWRSAARQGVVARLYQCHYRISQASRANQSPREDASPDVRPKREPYRAQSV